MRIKPDVIWMRATRTLRWVKGKYGYIATRLLGEKAYSSSTYFGRSVPDPYLGVTGDRYCRINRSLWWKFPIPGWVMIIDNVANRTPTIFPRSIIITEDDRVLIDTLEVAPKSVIEVAHGYAFISEPEVAPKSVIEVAHGYAFIHEIDLLPQSEVDVDDDRVFPDDVSVALESEIETEHSVVTFIDEDDAKIESASEIDAEVDYEYSDNPVIFNYSDIDTEHDVIGPVVEENAEITSESSVDIEHEIEVYEEEVVLAVSTVDAYNIEETSADLYGNITQMDGVDSVDSEFEYRKVGGATNSVSAGVQNSTGNFYNSVTGLDHNTDYEFRPHIYGGGQNDRGEWKQFKTKEEVVLAVTTESATDVEEESATIRGDITQMDGVDFVISEFEWGVDGETIYTDWAGDKYDTGMYSYDLTGLQSATKYRFRAKISESGEVAYGGWAYFWTPQDYEEENAEIEPESSIDVEDEVVS